MRILHVAPVPSTNASGFFHSVRGLARSQAKLGHSVTLLNSVRDRSTAPDIVSDSRTDDVTTVAVTRLSISPWISANEQFEEVIRAVGRPDICVFHGTYLPFHSAFARACTRRNVPYVITPRGDLSVFAQRVKPLKKFLGNLLFARSYIRGAAAAHALCERERQDILRFSPTARVFVIPNAVDTAFVSKRVLDRPSINTFRVLFIGRLDTYIKGLDLLFDAIAQLQSKTLERELEFVLAGPFYTERDRSYLTRRQRTLPSPDAVRFTGLLDEPSKLRWLQLADCVVCSSRSEGMPISVIEAMALGIPTVVTEGSGMGDLVEETMCGIRTEADGISIANAIARVASDFHSAQRMGMNARTLVRSSLTWPIVGERHVRHLELVAAGRTD